LQNLPKPTDSKIFETVTTLMLWPNEEKIKPLTRSQKKSGVQIYS